MRCNARTTHASVCYTQQPSHRDSGFDEHKLRGAAGHNAQPILTVDTG
jgi:hypothetical protein